MSTKEFEQQMTEELDAEVKKFIDDVKTTFEQFKVAITSKGEDDLNEIIRDYLTKLSEPNQEEDYEQAEID